jgi:branched-chain amino acid transport system substrate-binding protein
MPKVCAVLASVLCAVVLQACGSGNSGGQSAAEPAPKPASGEPIVLGFAIGKTGFMEPFDVPALGAANEAITKLNAQGGAAGREFEVVSADMKSKPELAGDAATSVIQKGADIVVTSCDFDQGSPAAVVAQGQGKLAFSTCAASAGFGPSGIGPLAFTMATAAAAEGAVMAEWAYDDKGYRTAYSLLDDTITFTKESNAGFVKRWQSLGGELVGRDTFKQSDQSLAAQINKIRRLPQQPDVLFLASYMPGEASAMKQIRAAGLDMPILADEDVDGDFWKKAVPKISNVYYATYASIYGDDPEPEVNALVDSFKRREGKLPDNAAFLTGYAMVQAIAEAVKGTKGSTDGKALQAQLETFRDEPLLLPTTFTKESHITSKRKLRIMQIQKGKTTLLTPKVPAEVPSAQD